jgi:hypothetical protein
MSVQPWTGDEAFRRELSMLSKTRLKMQISSGVLIAIVAASHVIEGILQGTLTDNSPSLFFLVIGCYIAVHYSMLLKAKRALPA